MNKVKGLLVFILTLAVIIGMSLYMDTLRDGFGVGGEFFLYIALLLYASNYCAHCFCDEYEEDEDERYL